jgi:hypothetical protein
VIGYKLAGTVKGNRLGFTGLVTAVGAASRANANE